MHVLCRRGWHGDRLRARRWGGERREDGGGGSLIVYLIGAAAWAGGLHSGVDPDLLPLLGEVTWLASPAGWTAAVLDDAGGRVRLQIYPDAAGAAAGLEQWVAASERSWPALPLGVDEGRGDGVRSALAREGNLVLIVERPKGGALELATLVLSAIGDDGGAWPDAPSLAVSDDVLRVEGSWEAMTFHHPPVLDMFTLKPREVRLIPEGDQGVRLGPGVREITVTVWDRWGRAAAATWRAPDSAAR